MVCKPAGLDPGISFYLEDIFLFFMVVELAKKCAFLDQLQKVSVSVHELQDLHTVSNKK